jgi:polyketide cyclase/dehydrase/lipid transport protein
VALVQSQHSSGEISAAGKVAASPEEVFAFLSDLENHWLLADRFVEVLTLDRGAEGAARGGRVRMRGPLGLGRTATTRVVSTESPVAMTGTADLSGGTRAVIRWRLAGESGATRVELAAHLERASWLDRLLLALGGRMWTRRRFATILQTLASRFN